MLSDIVQDTASPKLRYECLFMITFIRSVDAILPLECMYPDAHLGRWSAYQALLYAYILKRVLHSFLILPEYGDALISCFPTSSIYIISNDLNKGSGEFF